MGMGLTLDLIVISLIVGALCFFVVSRDLSFGASFILSFVKVLIPLIYFAWIYDGFFRRSILF